MKFNWKKHLDLIRTFFLGILNLIIFPVYYFFSGYEHYVFVLTTGRSGSAALSNLLENINSINSYHEPYPIMNNRYRLPKIILKFWYPFLFYFVKYPTILKSHKDGKSVYVETNHLFLKTFSQYAIRFLGKKIKLIHLVREPYKVAKSMYDIHTIPGDYHSSIWYLDPYSRDNLLSYRKIKKRLNKDYLSQYEDFFKCLWYWYEMEKRAEVLIKRNRNIDLVKINTSELNNSDLLVKKITNKLNINVNYSNNTIQLQDNQKNKKTTEKKRSFGTEKAKKLNNLFKEALMRTHKENGRSVIV